MTTTPLPSDTISALADAADAAERYRDAAPEIRDLLDAARLVVAQARGELSAGPSTEDP
jgi:hypothetical protein